MSIERGLAVMAEKRYALVPIRDRWYFCAPLDVPDNPPPNFAIITPGRVYRMGFWDTPAEALDELGREEGA